MDRTITASDISDYASTISLTEINDSVIESVYIYYSVGEFGISSSGKVSWQEYTDIYEIESNNQELMSGELLGRNNQRVICHDVTLTKNAKKIRGFFLIQTIPLENSYSGEANVLFFVPYSSIYSYIEKFTDGGIGQLCLTDGSKVLYTGTDMEGYLEEGELLGELKAEDTQEQPLTLRKYEKEKLYVSEYTKTGMDIGVLQILDNAFLYRDFFAFLKWITVGDLLLTVLIFIVASKLANRTYQPLEHIVNLLDEEQTSSGDEYQMIERALKDLESQKEKLEVAVYEQNPLIEQYLLHGLLGGKKLDAMEEKYINMMRQYSTFRSLALSDGPEAKQYITEVDTALAIYPQIHAAFLKEDKHYFWILSYGEESIVEEISELITQTFQELGYRDAVLAFGGAYDEIRSLPETCHQAAETLNYHFFFSEKKVLFFDREGIVERSGNQEVFQVTEEERATLQNLAEALSADDLVKVYGQILIRNFDERKLAGTEWFGGVRRLNEEIAGIFQKQGTLMEQMDILMPENFGTLENYLQTFRLKMENWVERRQVWENPMYAARNEKIRQYVEEHLTDANLSLNETARVMHYTATYFGKYFKEQFGCVFQQYVAVRRIECAKEYLLKDPDGKKMSIQEIALKCGFTNDVTFRRTFKRYVGMTPSQFCKEEM